MGKKQHRRILPLILLALLVVAAGLLLAPGFVEFAPERQNISTELPAERFLGKES